MLKDVKSDFFLNESRLITTGPERVMQFHVAHFSIFVLFSKHVAEERKQSYNGDAALCCHLGIYFKRSESGPVRPLACKWYYCAQFTAKPKAVCFVRINWAVTSSRP